jgi:hypothetical protein
MKQLKKFINSRLGLVMKFAGCECQDVGSANFHFSPLSGMANLVLIEYLRINEFLLCRPFSLKKLKSNEAA